MRIRKTIGLCLALLLLAGCGKQPDQASFPCSVSSPDGTLTVSVGHTSDGQPCYKLERCGAEVIKTSRLGFQLSVGDNTKAMRDNEYYKGNGFDPSDGANL